MEKKRLGLWAPIAGVAAALVMLAVSTGTVEAGKGGNGGSITVPDGVFGGTTTATVNPGGDNAWVHAQCFQNGNLVYEQYVEADSSNQAMLQLGPTPSWISGDADCTAEEGYFGRGGRWRSIASTTFHAFG